ncbi:MAG: hypothetical protein JWQ11_1692 [Rhizobacter sp.]|nr:hypothetical protein [Rhizobacter sp.]
MNGMSLEKIQALRAALKQAEKPVAAAPTPSGFFRFPVFYYTR